MKRRTWGIHLFVLGIGLIGLTGCTRAVRDGLSIGLTDGLSDAIAQLVGDVVGSIVPTDG